MTSALVPIVQPESYTKMGPYLYQEWNSKRELRRLNGEIRPLLSGMPEFFHSDITTMTNEISGPSDFWDTPIRYVQIIVDLATETGTRIHKAYEEELATLKKSMQGPVMGIDADLLDWETHIETPPPPKLSGTIKVRFKYIGRSKPIPLSDPWA